MAFPVLMSSFMIFGMAMIRRNYPGMMELSMLLQHAANEVLDRENEGRRRTDTAPDRQIAIFIASHYRATITNDASWNSPIALSMIKGDDRRFAEQSVAEHPAPTEKEIADADAALKPYLLTFETSAQPPPLFFVTVLLGIYVCLPALIAALLFRGGLMLRMAGITFVRRDGRRASRLRVFWRAFVAWSPLWLALFGFASIFGKPNAVCRSSELTLVLYCGLYCGLAILSVALPERGLPDRLAGTWPVPR